MTHTNIHDTFAVYLCSIKHVRRMAALPRLEYDSVSLAGSQVGARDVPLLAPHVLCPPPLLCTALPLQDVQDLPLLEAQLLGVAGLAAEQGIHHSVVGQTEAVLDTCV